MARPLKQSFKVLRQNHTQSLTRRWPLPEDRGRRIYPMATPLPPAPAFYASCLCTVSEVLAGQMGGFRTIVFFTCVGASCLCTAFDAWADQWQDL